MAKERGRPGRSRKDIQALIGGEAKGAGGQAGDRGEGIWINDEGELCVGTACFGLRFKPGDREVRVHIDRNECGADLQPVIDELYKALGRGAPTVYETTSRFREEK